ncbi:MAG TPA: hypothetical protein PK323_03180 [Bacteroidia bacterium]|nr:hypothetical protein [Bacteroidia bacterium]
MKKLRNIFIYTITFLLVGVFSACLKGNFKFKKIADSFWEPDVAVPLVNSSMTLSNILKLSAANNNFSIASDNFVTLVYRGNLFSLRADEAFKIPDQPINTSFTFPSAAIQAFNLINLQDTFILNPPFTTTVDFNTDAPDAFIDSFSVKNCLLALNLISSFQQQLLVTLNIPDARKNGVPFSQTIEVPPAGSSTITRSVNFNLANYKINLNQNGTPNKLKLNFSIKFIKTNTSILPNHNSIDVVMSFSDIAYKNLFGSIGQRLLSPDTDTVPITLFNNSLIGGGISLVNASLGINISNAFGLPIRANFQKLQGYNPNSLTPIVNVVSPIFNTPLPIPVPQQIGQSATSNLVLNSSNSNIDNVLSNLPRHLIYKIDALSNPPPPFIPMQNFIEDSSRFKVDVDINIPLEGKLNNLVFQDTIMFKFQDVDELQSLGLKLFFKNGFPIETKVQVYFADTLGYVLDSLLQDDILLASAFVGSNGRVTTATEKNTEIIYPEDKILRLKKVRKIFVKATTNTFQNGTKNVKIYSDYRIDLKISGRAKLKFKI